VRPAQVHRRSPYNAACLTRDGRVKPQTAVIRCNRRNAAARHGIEHADAKSAIALPVSHGMSPAHAEECHLFQVDARLYSRVMLEAKRQQLRVRRAERAASVTQTSAQKRS